MKTKALLLICLFIGNGITQLSAQDPPGSEIGNGAIHFFNSYSIEIPIYCENCSFESTGPEEREYIDLLKGDVLQTSLQTYAGTGIYVIRGELTSDKTGEVFKLNWNDKATLDIGESFSIEWIDHLNIIGENGTHYILTMETYMQLDPYEYYFRWEAKCPGNKE